jgi:Cytochrome c
MAFRIASVVPIAIIALNASVWSQDLDFGKTEFLSKCAECHGADGKGAGPRSAEMKKKPADLTILAKNNNGVFAADAVHKIIDGREARTSHGSSKMPIWGCRHLSPPAPRPNVIHGWFFSRRHVGSKKVKKPTADPLESFEDLSCDPEPVIQRRIGAIVEYLRQIQEK